MLLMLGARINLSQEGSSHPSFSSSHGFLFLLLLILLSWLPFPQQHPELQWDLLFLLSHVGEVLVLKAVPDEQVL